MYTCYNIFGDTFPAKLPLVYFPAATKPDTVIIPTVGTAVGRHTRCSLVKSVLLFTTHEFARLTDSVVL
jgi:hypothetical protein